MAEMTAESWVIGSGSGLGRRGGEAVEVGDGAAAGDLARRDGDVEGLVDQGDVADNREGVPFGERAEIGFGRDAGGGDGENIGELLDEGREVHGLRHPAEGQVLSMLTERSESGMVEEGEG